MENDYEEKLGPAYDAIRADLLMHYQDRVWEMNKHVSTVELASLAGFYYLLDGRNAYFAPLLLAVACLFIYFLKQSIVRYTYLASSASLALKNGRDIYLDYKPGQKRGVLGFKIAQRIPMSALILNSALIAISSYWLFVHKLTC